MQDQGQRLPVAPHRAGIHVVDGYISTSTPPGIGQAQWEALQRSQIAAWTAGQAWCIARMVEEHEPGPGSDPPPSPALAQAIRRVESGETDGIIVSRLRAVGFTLVDAAGVVERIHAAGGVFVSVSDGIDLSRPAGRPVLRLLLSLLDQERSA